MGVPAEVRRWLDALGAGPVPVPGALGDRLRLRDPPGLVSTRQRTIPPYRLREYLDELDGPGVEGDYLVVGPDGHGLASRAMHYYLVLGGLALFVQSRWGTAYEPFEHERARLAHRLQSVAAILDAGPERLGERRLVVVASDFEGERAELWRAGHLVAAADTFPLDALGTATGWLAA